MSIDANADKYRTFRKAARGSTDVSSPVRAPRPRRDGRGERSGRCTHLRATGVSVRCAKKPSQVSVSRLVIFVFSSVFASSGVETNPRRRLSVPRACMCGDVERRGVVAETAGFPPWPLVPPTPARKAHRRHTARRALSRVSTADRRTADEPHACDERSDFRIRSVCSDSQTGLTSHVATYGVCATRATLKR